MMSRRLFVSAILGFGVFLLLTCVECHSEGKGVKSSHEIHPDDLDVLGYVTSAGGGSSRNFFNWLSAMFFSALMTLVIQAVVLTPQWLIAAIQMVMNREIEN